MGRGDIWPTNATYLTWSRPRHQLMACQRVSVEIWQKILRYAIAVPVFFEKDPIGTCGYQEFVKWFSEDKVYWAAERDRNALRRVCYAWNNYLIRFDHRYVNLDDVEVGTVPISTISRAIKLRYDAVEYKADFQALLLVRCTDEETTPWSLEILYGGTSKIADRLIKMGRIPHIGSIVCSEESLIYHIPSLAPNLEFFWGRPYGYNISPKVNVAGRECVEFSHLTSLSIFFDGMNHILDHSFPALNHLSLYPRQYHRSAGGPYARSATPEQLTTILKSLGQNLVTFIDNSDITSSFLPSELSTLCPKLKWLSTNHACPLDVQVPRSLETFQVSYNLPYYSLYPYEHQLPKSFLQKVRHVTVALNNTWMEVFEGNSALVLETVLYVMSYGLSVVDVMGISFQELIVALLMNRRQENCWDAFNWTQRYRYF